MYDFRFKCEQLITDPEINSINILIQSLYLVIGPQRHMKMPEQVLKS